MNKRQITRYTFITAWVVLAAFGIYIANKTYQYEILVKGILGLAFLYLLFSYFRYSGTDKSLDAMLSDPRPYTHLIYAFIGPILAWWATGSVFDMLEMLAKTWFGL